MTETKNRTSERIELISDDSKNVSFFDLSATGICLHHSAEMAKGETAVIKINDLSVKATVVYCMPRTDGYRIGMQFVSVAEAEKQRLSDIVDKYSRGVPITCGIEGQRIGGATKK